MMISLNNFKWFIRYQKFNCLDNEPIRQAAAYFQYKKYNKGEYIFHNRDKSDCFYGIIKGKVSIRGFTYQNYKPPSLDEDYELGIDYETIMSKYEYKENILSPNELRYNLEYERIVFQPGMCFGEWGIIYNSLRTASAYCVEDTEVFFLSKEHFLNIFRSCFYNSISTKKKFLNKIIPCLGIHFSYLIPKYFDYGDIIYSPKNTANNMYIVYQGECALGYLNSEDFDESVKARNFHKFSILSKGSISGMESVRYYNRKKKGNYTHTLVANQDYTVVYEINVELVYRQGLYLIDYILPMYKLQNEIHRCNLDNIENNKQNHLQSEKKQKKVEFNCINDINRTMYNKNSKHNKYLSCNLEHFKQKMLSRSRKRKNCISDEKYLTPSKSIIAGRKMTKVINSENNLTTYTKHMKISPFSSMRNTNCSSNTFLTNSKAKYELTTTSEHKLKLPRIKKKKTSAIKDKFILTTLQRFKMNVISKEGHQRKYNSGYYEMPMCHSLMCIENNNK